MARHFHLPVPGVEVRALASGGGNFLWLATNHGLFRFDGQHFERMLDADLRSVASTNDGWIWAGGAKGLTALRDGSQRRMSELPVASLVARDREVVFNAGRLFRGTIDGITQLDVRVQGTLALDRDRRVWFGCGTEVCSLDGLGRIQHIGQKDGLPAEQWLSAIRSDEGTMLAQRELAHGRLEFLFYHPGGGSVRAVSGGAALPPDYAWYRAHDGTVWTGVGRVDGDKIITTSQLQGLFGTSHTEDWRGNHWIATIEGDLYLLSARQWVSVWRAPTFTATPERSMRTADGRLLVSCNTGLVEFDPSLERWRDLPGDFAFNDIAGVAEAAHGGLWVVFPNHGIRRVTIDGRTVKTIYKGPRTALAFRGILKDRDGHIWVGSKRQFFRIDEAAEKLMEVRLPGGGANAVAFASGPDGQEWLGYDGGIARREGLKWKLVVPAEVFADPRIRSIAVGPGPEFWVSYRRSIPISVIRPDGAGWKRRDLPFDATTDPQGIVRDRRGWIWVGSDTGLLVTDGVHLQPDDWVILNEYHNLPSKSIQLDGLTEDSDGSILVSTEHGLARVEGDPAWFAPSQELPRVTGIRWPGGGQNLGPFSGARLPSPVHDFEITFARWPAGVPRDDRFQYRLTPLETEWKDGNEGKAHYDMIAPGPYVFEIKTRESEPVSSFRFEIQGPGSGLVWWLCAATAACLGLVWLWWSRVRMSAQYTQYWAAKNAFLAVRNRAANIDDPFTEVLSGRYAIEEPIGRGGFSTVYRARDTESGDCVALKCFNDVGELPDWRRRRFEKEISALRRLSSPGLVRLLDSGWISERQPFLVMDLIEGPTLRMVLRAGPVEKKRAARWVAGIGEALEAAHREAVLHRDLKPENILIAGANTPSEHVVVVDFGAATIHEAGVHEASSFALASFGYMAPERILGRSSPATDVYSLAAVAFEVLTGTRYSNLADPTPPGLRIALAAFSMDVLILLAAGLTYVPEHRPQKAGEFARQLAAALEE